MVIRKGLFWFFIFFLHLSWGAYKVTVPLRSFYAYDKLAPLQAEVKPLKLKSSAIKGYEITFNSVHDERVSSILYLPAKKKGPFPVILFLHGYGMKRELPEAAVSYIAGEGYAFFAISLKYTNERKVEGKPLASAELVRFRDAIIQTVIDFRRGIDYLETRKDIDAKRIGVVGLSMGSIIGSVLFSVDPRIRTATFGVGGANFPIMIMNTFFMGPTFDPRKLGYSFQELYDIVAPADAVNLAYLSEGRPVLMINGRYDQIVPPPAARALYGAFSEPKHQKWFDGGHVPSVDTILSLVKDLLSWFRTYLKPKTLPVLPAQKNHIPQLTDLKIKAPAQGVQQGKRVWIGAHATDLDHNIAFVKAYIEGADSEVLLYDSGDRKQGDRKKGDGIFSARALIPRTSQIGETRVKAYVVDYNGAISRPLFGSFDILPILFPPNTHPPQITSYTLPKTITIGDKVKIEVEAQDPDGDLSTVEATVEEFGLSVALEQDPKKKTHFLYSLEIPDLVPEGTYHISLRAKDKIGRKSPKITQAVSLVPKK